MGLGKEISRKVNKMDKRWIIKKFNKQVASHLQQQLNVHPVICQLLAQRGITTFEEARDFFRPQLSHLHDPFLMKDMDKAVDRIHIAMINKEKILIYGDYDVDGTTSVALVYSFLRKIYFEVDYYLPNRYTEGYGISSQGIDWAKENGYSLIIALDCGIKSIDKIDYANERGIDFIICDHHLPGEKIPSAVAVLDPKRTDCEYPYKELSGCGIGFKLMEAYAKTHDTPKEELFPLLDLAAVSIASDIVPITGENRIIAHFGLQQLNTNPRPGLKALIESSGLKRTLTITDIVFSIGPRINAAGRIDDARNAVRLLISENPQHAVNNAEILNQKNTERREFDMNITTEALEILRSDPLQQNKKTTVLFQSHWHKGVIGIVASRMLDEFYRPTIILTESNGVVAGSARSVAGYDIYEAIQECSDLLEQFGGHKFAAGLTMKKENVTAFSERFEEVVAGTIEESMLIPEVAIDSELTLTDINLSFYNLLRQFEPFGPQNMTPIFLTRGVKDTGYSRIVKEEHLRLSVKKGDNITVTGIGFGLKDLFPIVQSGNGFDIAYSLEESEWNGNKRIEIRARDLKAPV